MFYRVSVGECVCQVYRIDVDPSASWEDVKRLVFDDMDVGDHIAKCDPDAVVKYLKDYHYIVEDSCVEFATLCKGAWIVDESGNEDWLDNIYYFSDDPETLLDGSGNDFIV